jgi:hypothetical protein
MSKWFTVMCYNARPAVGYNLQVREIILPHTDLISCKVSTVCCQDSWSANLTVIMFFPELNYIYISDDYSHVSTGMIPVCDFTYTGTN